jgi:hypothetical protein
MQSHRNVLIRSVAGLSGDIAAGLVVVSACAWLIQYAALGLFLSFLLWLLGALIALAVSQRIVHPAVKLLLSDRKLDAAITAATRGAQALVTAVGTHRTPWINLLRRFADNLQARAA